MAGTCDICGGKTGFMNTFRCQDGTICKNCYRIVSNNYTSTITKLTLLELKKNYIKNAPPVDMGENGFQVTKKIGTFLLLDKKNRKFCLLSNHNLTKEFARPEIYLYDDLESYKLVSEPKFSVAELHGLSENKDRTAVVQKLAIRLQLNRTGIRDIMVIPSPVRISSFAFRKSYKAVNEIMQALDEITQ